jgi:hypothetical protein
MQMTYICSFGSLFESQTSGTHPTRMPSSMSVGATESAKSTTNLANCFTLMMYFGSSESALMIFVHLATWKNQNIVCTGQTGVIICCTLPLNTTVPAQSGCLMLIILYATSTSTATETSCQNVFFLQKQILNYNVVVLYECETFFGNSRGLTVLEHKVIRSVFEARQLTISELNHMSHNS